MTTAAEVLLIVVSATLSLFLLVAIIALVKLVQLLNGLKRVVAKAEKVADSAEAVGDFFRKSAGPVAFGRFLTNIVETVHRHKKTK